MWTYRQSSGEMSNATQVWLGYSGVYNWAGLGWKTPQAIKDVGPIPVGRYSIGSETTEIGPVTLPLTPAASNEMFGRSGFRIHGEADAHPGHASSGCIVMSYACREAIVASQDTELEVIS